MIPPRVWIGVVEVTQGDSELLSNADGAFVKVLAWASSNEEFCSKARELMDYLQVKVIGMHEVRQFSSVRGADHETKSIALELQADRNAIRYATFHTWTGMRH